MTVAVSAELCPRRSSANVPPSCKRCLLAVGLVVVASVLWLAEPRDSRAAIALRKRLVSARRHFRNELEKTEPNLDDQWLSYLIALDLVPAVDSWFRAFGVDERRDARTASDERAWSSSSSSSQYSSRPAPSERWTGGGGCFGGGGASASWASAASNLAAGVAAPSRGSDSSSSRGSSSGGGGW